ncbi:MAG: type II secretion system F family protein [Planctomycetes bacterium]|nr:type II secretion system F family protein [Planctomycetota bacterium]
MFWSAPIAFYHQLALMTRAGMTLGQALDYARGVTTGWYREHAGAWAAGCQGGTALAPQLRDAGEDHLPVALIEAGERSGRLPEMCAEISSFYEHQRALVTMALGKLLYPLLLAHVALIMPGIINWFLHGSVRRLIIGPAILWAVLATALIAWLVLRRTTVPGKIALLPLVRSITLPLVAANTCLVVRGGLAAGMLYHQALDLAAPACGNRVFADRLRRVSDDLARGRLPGLTPALAAAGMPRVVVELLSTAEHAGALEESLGRCAALQREAFRERTAWATRILCGLFYALAIVLAVVTIVSMYGAYLGQVSELAGEMDAQ